MTNSDQTLLHAADELAKDVDALAIISFLPKPPSITLNSYVYWVTDIRTTIPKDQHIETLMEYYSSNTRDAILQYDIITRIKEGKIVAVFPFALLIYDIDLSDRFNIEDYAYIASTDVIHSIIQIALEIGHEGREGRSVGTAFIIGDVDELMLRSHQGIINPYNGHPLEVRDVRVRANWESIKEFAQLDGMFLIDSNGYIVAAGRYFDVDGRGIDLPSGFGGRHRATAAITKVVSAIGITVSESGGIVRVFVGGEIVSQIRSDIKLTSYN